MSANRQFERWFQPWELTDTKLPKYLEEETAIQRVDNVSLYYGKVKVHRSGAFILTSHRILFQHKDAMLALPLASVKTSDTKAGFVMASSPKLVVHLNPLQPKARPIPKGLQQSMALQVRNIPIQPPEPGYLMYSFHDDSPAASHQKLTSALKMKAWVETKTNEKKGFSAANAGIRGILRNEKARREQTSNTVSVAFQDLDQLMAHARQMVKIAERFAASQEARSNQDEFDKMMSDLGIDNPVTKETAGRGYHEQLARQLAQFLKKPLERRGGMMSLVDVYCLYNRARGTELVSPKDLVAALKMMSRFKLPVKLRVFKSGVKVAQLATQSEAERAKTVLKAVEERKEDGISELELSTKLNLSVQLAMEELLATEEQALICRDEHLNGIRFYPNFFLQQEAAG